MRNDAHSCTGSSAKLYETNSKKQIAELVAKIEMHLVDNKPTPYEYWNAVDFLFSEEEKY